MSDQETGNLEELLHSGYRYAYSLTHNKANAEDIVQDAWLAVIKARGPQTRAYLFSAVRSRFLNTHKRESLVAMVSYEDVPESEGESGSLEIPCHLEEAILDNALNSLRSLEREALYLFAVEDYTAAEIAEFTQQPRNTVLSHIHRAKKKVKQLIETQHAEVAP